LLASVARQDAGARCLCQSALRYVSLDDPDVRRIALDDPRGFLARFRTGRCWTRFSVRRNSCLTSSYLQRRVDAGRLYRHVAVDRFCAVRALVATHSVAGRSNGLRVALAHM